MHKSKTNQTGERQSSLTQLQCPMYIFFLEQYALWIATIYGCVVLEITVGHQTLSNQILKMSGQFRIMIGHNDRASHLHILSYLLLGVVSQ